MGGDWGLSFDGGTSVAECFESSTSFDAGIFSLVGPTGVTREDSNVSVAGTCAVMGGSSSRFDSLTVSLAGSTDLTGEDSNESVAGTWSVMGASFSRFNS